MRFLAKLRIRQLRRKSLIYSWSSDFPNVTSGEYLCLKGNTTKLTRKYLVQWSGACDLSESIKQKRCPASAACCTSFFFAPRNFIWLNWDVCHGSQRFHETKRTRWTRKTHWICIWQITGRTLMEWEGNKQEEGGLRYQHELRRWRSGCLRMITNTGRLKRVRKGRGGTMEGKPTNTVFLLHETIDRSLPISPACRFEYRHTITFSKFCLAKYKRREGGARICLIKTLLLQGNWPLWCLT